MFKVLAADVLDPIDRAHLALKKCALWLVLFPRLYERRQYKRQTGVFQLFLAA